jgi:hypothetical protein
MVGCSIVYISSSYGELYSSSAGAMALWTLWILDFADLNLGRRNFFILWVCFLLLRSLRRFASSFLVVRRLGLLLVRRRLADPNLAECIWRWPFRRRRAFLLFERFCNLSSSEPRLSGSFLRLFFFGFFFFFLGFLGFLFLFFFFFFFLFFFWRFKPSGFRDFFFGFSVLKEHFVLSL